MRLPLALLILTCIAVAWVVIARVLARDPPDDPEKLVDDMIRHGYRFADTDDPDGHAETPSPTRRG